MQLPGLGRDGTPIKTTNDGVSAWISTDHAVATDEHPRVRGEPAGLVAAQAEEHSVGYACRAQLDARGQGLRVAVGAPRRVCCGALDHASDALRAPDLLLGKPLGRVGCTRLGEKVLAEEPTDETERRQEDEGSRRAE